MRTPTVSGCAQGDAGSSPVDQIKRLFDELSWQGHRLFARRVDAFGLTVPQFLVLSTVEKLGPGVTMGDLGESLQLPPSSMTSIADRLVKDGLVTRGSLPGDRRAVAASITPLGADVVRRVEVVRRRELVTMLDGLSDDDLERFRFVLAHMLDDIEQALASP